MDHHIVTEPLRTTQRGLAKLITFHPTAGRNIQQLITMTSHCITRHDTTQAITSHQMTWPPHHLTPQQTLRHQNTSLQSTRHHPMERQKARSQQRNRAGRSPCTHSIGKFFLCYIALFSSETSAPGSPGNYLYHIISYHIISYHIMWMQNISLHIIASAGMAMSRSIIACQFMLLLLCWNGQQK